MDNHFHLLVETPESNISDAMQSLQSGYANWFKARYKLVGSVFQSRFKAILVENSSYLLMLLVYIHRNPVRAGLVAKEHDYHWSSSKNYDGSKVDEITSTERLLAEAGGVDNYLCISCREMDLEHIYGKNSIIGSDIFYAKMQKQAREQQQDKNIPELVKVMQYSTAAIEHAVMHVMHIDKTALYQKRSRELARKFFIHFLKHETALKMAEIAAMMNSSHVAVTILSCGFERELQKNKKLQKIYGEIKEKLHAKL